MKKRRTFRGWGSLNQERQKLIVKKHKGGGLTKDEEDRLVMLQKIAEAVMNYVAPLRCDAGLRLGFYDEDGGYHPEYM